MSLDLYVENLSSQERLDILDNHEELRESCVLGDDEPLRQHAEVYMNQIGMSNSHVDIIAMEAMANACYRYYALKYIAEA